MKTLVLISTLLISMNVFAGGSVGLDQAIDELTNGIKNDKCSGDMDAQPALAQALKKLDLNEVGLAVRIGHNNEDCTGTRVMPYWFKSKDGKLKVQVLPEVIIVQQVVADEYEDSMDFKLTPSIASLSLGTVLKKNAFKEIANGRKAEQYCTKATKGYPALAKALTKLNLSDYGIGVRIPLYSVNGMMEGYCSGLILMPYAFKTKDGKLTIEIQDGTFIITPTALRGL